MANYLKIKQKKARHEALPDYLEEVCGLADVKNGNLLLPIEYEKIQVDEKLGFVWTLRKDKERNLIEEVYVILESGELEQIKESESEFEFQLMNSDLRIFKIDGEIKVIRILRK